MAVDLNPEVLALVRRELAKPKNGPTDGKAIKKMAEAIDPKIRDLSIFAFSGRYLRHVQAERARKGGTARKTGAAKGVRKGIKRQVGRKATAGVKAKPKKATKRMGAPAKKGVRRMAVKKQATGARKMVTKAAARNGGTRRTMAAPGRDRLHSMMIKFAQDVSAATGDPGKLVSVIDSVDSRIEAALR